MAPGPTRARFSTEAGQGLRGTDAGDKANPAETSWRPNVAVASEQRLLPRGLHFHLCVILLRVCASRWEDTKRFLETEGP